VSPASSPIQPIALICAGHTRPVHVRPDDDRAGGLDIVLDEMPQLDQELAGDSNDADSFRAFSPSTEALLEPSSDTALRLVPQPQPGQLDQLGAKHCPLYCVLCDAGRLRYDASEANAAFRLCVQR
jgi:hypothetical protein